MKSRHIWFELITHDRSKKWRWKPTFFKSNIVYELGGKGWIAPIWEFTWLCFGFRWKGYSHKRLWRDNVINHECPAELMQERINELEAELCQIRKSK